jgi:hypothetical protein
MSFGQSTGPAAGHGQLKDLQALLARAGYDDFRSARGPYQLTQRQGGGKFTRDEADELIARLREELGDPSEEVAPAPAKPAAAAAKRMPVPAAGPAKKPATLRTLPDAVLVGELERRGFTVIPPSS